MGYLFHKQKRNAQAGMSLIETIVALAVFGIVVVATSDFLSKSNDRKNNDKLRDAQIAIVDSIKSRIKSPGNIYYSVAHYVANPNMSNCILNLPVEGASGCSTAIDANNPASFALFLRTEKSGAIAKQVSNGESAGDVVRYDRYGSVCEKKLIETDYDDELCPFEVSSHYYVTCEGDEDPLCSSGAKQVYLKFEVFHVVSNPLQSKLPTLPKINRYISMSTSQIVGPQRNSECGGASASQLDAYVASDDDENLTDFNSQFSQGNFATLTGYDDYGNPICGCLYPFKEVGSETDPETQLTIPVCELLTKEELACGSEDYFRGFDENGNILCQSEEESFQCSESFSYSTIGGESGAGANTVENSCDGGFWLTNIERTGCIFSCTYEPDDQSSCDFEWTVHGNSQVSNDNYKNPISQDFSCQTIKRTCCQPKGQ